MAYPLSGSLDCDGFILHIIMMHNPLRVRAFTRGTRPDEVSPQTVTLLSLGCDKQNLAASLTSEIRDFSIQHPTQSKNFGRRSPVQLPAEICRLISFDISNHKSTLSGSAHLDDVLDELETIHIRLTRDDLAGLVLQNGLASDPHLANKFIKGLKWCIKASTKGPCQLNPRHIHNMRTIPLMILTSWLSKLDCSGSEYCQTTCCVTFPFVNVPTLVEKTTILLHQTTGHQPIPPMTFAILSTINNHQPHQPDLWIGKDLNIVFKESTQQLPTPSSCLFEEDHQARSFELANTYFAYNTQQDCFNIYSKHNFLVFKCPFVSKHNKRIFSRPISLKNETFVTPLHIDKPHSPLTDMILSSDEQTRLRWTCCLVICNICTQSKIKQRNSLSKSENIEKKLEIITADIIRPFEANTFNKGRFLLTICDIATGFRKAKVLASKDQVAQILVENIQMGMPDRLPVQIFFQPTEDGGI
ncbi:uncharacterized protein VP01_1921g1 [Puccinia sorghi]|uniref:Uncharacterized protein n=1 Tax=Puccinia sorghi TaxID=27349 RepID=A0A0L6VCL1_9BASI|nr:uncharacterized protein VP01_1921g1 [Puccinia sorghi]